jgi:hypothetical protein
MLNVASALLLYHRCTELCLGRLLHRVVKYVRSVVFTAVTMKNAIFWDVMPCGSCKNRHCGGTYRLRHQGDKNQRARSCHPGDAGDTVL